MVLVPDFLVSKLMFSIVKVCVLLNNLEREKKNSYYKATESINIQLYFKNVKLPVSLWLELYSFCEEYSVKGADWSHYWLDLGKYKELLYF